MLEKVTRVTREKFETEGQSGKPKRVYWQYLVLGVKLSEAKSSC
jgi:hypothetical protein